MTPPQPGDITGLLRLVIGRRPWATLRRTFLLAAVTFCIFKFALRPSWTHGVSMEPTVHDGSLCFINLLAYPGNLKPARGDIVAIDTGHAKAMYLKRILGLPGETVAFSNGVLSINQIALDEPYVVYRLPWNMDTLTLGGSDYFVVGDNRGTDIDFHLHGPVNQEFILGKLLW